MKRLRYVIETDLGPHHGRTGDVEETLDYLITTLRDAYGVDCHYRAETTEEPLEQRQ